MEERSKTEWRRYGKLRPPAEQVAVMDVHRIMAKQTTISNPLCSNSRSNDVGHRGFRLDRGHQTIMRTFDHETASHAQVSDDRSGSKAVLLNPSRHLGILVCSSLDSCRGTMDQPPLTLCANSCREHDQQSTGQDVPKQTNEEKASQSLPCLKGSITPRTDPVVIAISKLISVPTIVRARAIKEVGNTTSLQPRLSADGGLHFGFYYCVSRSCVSAPTLGDPFRMTAA
jgi:hypothetical protein